MNRSVRRSILATALLVLPACSSGPATDNSIVVANVSRRGFASGSGSERRSPIDNGPSAVRVLVTTNGVEKALSATKNAAGDFVVPDGVAPLGPYVLELRYAPESDHPNDPPFITRAPIDDGARRVVLGDDYWARKDTVVLDDTRGALALDLEAPATIINGDLISIFSLRSYLYRQIFVDSGSEEQTSPPADGAMSSNGWIIPNELLSQPYGSDASGLPDAAAGDDLFVQQSRTTSVTLTDDRFDPWSSFDLRQRIGVLDATGATFTNGATNRIAGTLAAPATETLTVDFRGSSFAAVRVTGGVPSKTAKARVKVWLTEEAGAGPGYFTSVGAEAWYIETVSRKKPVEPACFPDAGGVCDPGTCPNGCNGATDGFVDPGDLSYELVAPRVRATGLRATENVSYSFSDATWKHPIFTDLLAPRFATSTIIRPRAQGGPLAMELGPVRDLKLDGMTLSFDETATVSESPTVSFSPPAIGVPEYYQIDVLQLIPDPPRDGEDPPVRRSLLRARMLTKETSYTIPAEVLSSSLFYYLQVSAVRDGRDFAAWGRYPADTVHVTEVMSPVFTR